MIPLGPTQRERDVAALERRIEPLLEEVLIRALSGTLEWNDYKVEIALDCIGGPLATRILYGADVPKDARGTKSPYYAHFEAFHKARQLGYFNSPVMRGVMMGLVGASVDLGARVTNFFEIRRVDETVPPPRLTPPKELPGP